MSTPTIRALRTLKTLAHIELGEAALQLAQAMDGRRQAAADLSRRAHHVQQLAAVYDRLTTPGGALHIGALGQLGRQTVAAQVECQNAKVKAEEADEAVDARRQIVHDHQSRHESLEGFLKEARRVHASEVEKTAEEEREDLFLTRRHAFRRPA